MKLDLSISLRSTFKPSFHFDLPVIRNLIAMKSSECLQFYDDQKKVGLEKPLVIKEV
jgi:hypothetical protein